MDLGMAGENLLGQRRAREGKSDDENRQRRWTAEARLLGQQFRRKGSVQTLEAAAQSGFVEAYGGPYQAVRLQQIGKGVVVAADVFVRLGQGKTQHGTGLWRKRVRLVRLRLHPRENVVASHYLPQHYQMKIDPDSR